MGFASFFAQFPVHPNQGMFAVTPPTLDQQQTNNPNPSMPPTSVPMGGIIGAGINKALQPLPAYNDLYTSLSHLGNFGGIRQALGTGVDDKTSQLAQMYAQRQQQQQALQTVLMRNPQTGQTHQIPQDQVAAAQASGGQVVQ